MAGLAAEAGAAEEAALIAHVPAVAPHAPFHSAVETLDWLHI
jgi:hypothetical protein